MGEHLLARLAEAASETGIPVISGICYCNNNTSDEEKTARVDLKGIVGKQRLHILNQSGTGYHGNHAAATGAKDGDGGWDQILDKLIRDCTEEGRREVKNSPKDLLSGVFCPSPWSGGHAPIAEYMANSLGDLKVANFMTISTIPSANDRRRGLARKPDFAREQTIKAGSKWLTYIDELSPLAAKQGHGWPQGMPYIDLLWAHWAAALAVGNFMPATEVQSFHDIVERMTQYVSPGEAVLINLGFGVRPIIPVPETKHNIFVRPFLALWREFADYKRQVKYGHILLMAQHAMLDAFFDRESRLFEGDPDSTAIERHNQYVTFQMNLDPYDKNSSRFLGRLQKDLVQFMKDPVNKSDSTDVADRVKQIMKDNNGSLPIDMGEVDLLVIPGKRGGPRPVDTNLELAPSTIQVTFAFQVEGTRPKAIQEICDLMKEPEAEVEDPAKEETLPKAEVEPATT